MFKLLLSFRYFRTRFMAFASLLAITFGVAMLVVVLSLMGGYLVQLQENIRGHESHLQILGPGQFGVDDVAELEELIRSTENVRGTSPFVERLAVYKAISFQPCKLEGVEPRKQMEVGDFARFVLRPAELEGILKTSGADGEAPPETDPRVAIRAVDDLIKDPERGDLGPEELEQLFSKEWREELLRRVDPGLVELLEGDIPPAALVGIQLLLERQVELGDMVTVVTLNPDERDPEPLEQDFVIAGALKSGDFKEDLRSIYAELGVVVNFLRLCDPQRGSCRYQGIRVALKDPEQLEETRRRLKERFGLTKRFDHLEVTTWKELKKNLLKAVLIEKFLVYFLVLILVVFTGSMVLLMLLLMVIEKTRDVGVLISLGATPLGVTSIFLINGLVICVLGTVLGLGLGLAFCTYINDIHDAIYDLTGWSLFKAEIYQMDRIPIAFEPVDILLSTVPPVLIGLLASLIPAVWAPRRDPIKAIQYE